MGHIGAPTQNGMMLRTSHGRYHLLSHMSIRQSLLWGVVALWGRASIYGEDMLLRRRLHLLNVWRWRFHLVCVYKSVYTTPYINMTHSVFRHEIVILVLSIIQSDLMVLSLYIYLYLLYFFSLNLQIQKILQYFNINKYKYNYIIYNYNIIYSR